MNEQTLITDYGTGNRLSETLSFIKQSVTNTSSDDNLKPLHILCKETPDRTVAEFKNGLSRPEIIRLGNSVKFMEKCRLPLHWVVIGDDILHMESGEARKELTRFKSRLGQAQKRAGFPQYCVEVLEVTGGLHGNFIFAGDEKLARKFCHSFSSYIQSGYGCGAAYGMQPVYNASKLASHYLIKERTVQATYSLCLPFWTREKGSHRMEGDGDRVRLSPTLRNDALAAKAIEPWQRTNACRHKFMSVAVIKASKTMPKPLPSERITP